MLRLRNLNKKLGSFSLKDITLDIPEGEYFVLLGRSGSGKTQLLELIAGLTLPDSGEIWLGDRNVTFSKITDRQTGLVFQDYAIFPNMTVFGNIAYPLHSMKMNRKEVGDKVKGIAEQLNIVYILDRFPDHLSGGELQRVALARTLVGRPRILLLDEPMASIDASLKDDIKRTFRKLHKSGLTIIHVTHDFREAVSLADRVGVIHNGRIIQEGTPATVFGHPVNKFVARYAGIRNFFKASFREEADGWKAKCDGELVLNISAANLPDEGLLVIRSEEIKLTLTEPANGSDNHFRGIVREINSSEYGMELIIDSGCTFFADLSLNEFKQLNIKEESQVWVTFTKEAAVALPGSGLC